eukprot:506518-Hanusia_phi.AAC.2
MTRLTVSATTEEQKETATRLVTVVPHWSEPVCSGGLRVTVLLQVTKKCCPGGPSSSHPVTVQGLRATPVRYSTVTG